MKFVTKYFYLLQNFMYLFKVLTLMSRVLFLTMILHIQDLVQFYVKEAKFFFTIV